MPEKPSRITRLLLRLFAPLSGTAQMPEKPNHITLPASRQNFVAVDFFDAVYKTENGEQHILIETRRHLDTSWHLFTVIEGDVVRATSIQDLILSCPDCISLSITHVVPVLWNGVSRKVDLIEIYFPTPNGSRWSVQLSLTIDETIYSTEACNSLYEALSELSDVIEISDSEVKWDIQTCLDCNFSYPAFLGPTDDRDDLRCYRDVPEAFTEQRQKGKFASNESLFAGAFFVNAFHRCAGWQPRPRCEDNDFPTQGE